MRRLGIFVLAMALAVFGGGGAAFAYLATSGAGSGAGTTTSLQPVTVAAFVGGDAPSSLLYPGGSADVILRVSNPNAFSVTLVSVSGNGTIAADAGHPLCTTTGVSFTNQSGLSVTIPPNGGGNPALVHLAGAASMSTASSNGCQGATFSIPVSITVHEG